MVEDEQDWLDTMKTEKHDAIVLSSATEKDAQAAFTRLLKQTPIPDDELLANLGVFLTSKTLSRILFFNEIYKKIVHTHGIVVECGVRWGQTLSLLSALRGIYEPFNRHRRIVGFDTFAGFVGMSEKDGERCKCADGSFSVSQRYEDTLAQVLSCQEALNPIPHLTKYELVKGDATATIPQYLEHHPETVVSLAIFDFDIYQPTRVALEALKPYFVKGTVLVFDELCDDIFPGETVALREVFDTTQLRVERLPITARVSYVVL
jgi:hypothetical protein